MEIKKLFIVAILLTLVSGVFLFYHSSESLKKQYEVICRQNYGDPLTFNRCMDTYSRHKKFYSDTTMIGVGLSIGLGMLATRKK